MTSDDRQQFAVEFARLAAVFTALTPSKPVAEVWFDAMAVVPIGLIRPAMLEFMRRDDEFPTPGKIIAIARQVQEQQRARQRDAHLLETGELLATDGTPIPSLIDQQATSLKRLALAAKLRERRAADEQQRSIEAEQDAADAVELARLAEGVATAEATESDPLARLRVVSEHAKLRAAIAHRRERSSRAVPSDCEVSQ